MTGKETTRGARRRRSGDGGSVSVLVLGVLAVLMVLAGASVSAAGLRVGSARAGAAADAAAVAAAAAAVGLVAGEPCVIAADIVRRDDADLVACSVDGAHARIRTEVRVGPFRASAAAHSGPALTPR